MFDIWTLLGGIGILFFGMETFEESIKKISGRKMKSLIQRFTNTSLKSIISGTVITGITQSSGIVSLLVLAFVSAGIMQLPNALGVIVGANLGSTLDSIVISYIGFGKISISALGLPCAGIGGIMLLFFKRESIRHVAKLLIGFGLIFIGLGFMKESVEYLKTVVDLSMYQHLSYVWFFVIGLVMTVVLQSSSAVILLGLTAFSTGIVTFSAICAIIIGANVGTTSTGLIASLGGKSIKRQVARSHALFNIFLCVIGLLFLKQYMRFVLEVLNLKTDPVFGAAIFNFVYKLSGVIIFAPFLKHYAHFLQRLIPTDKGSLALEIEQLALKKNLDSSLVGPQLMALHNDSKRLVRKTASYNTFVYGIDPHRLHVPGAIVDDIKHHLAPRNNEHHIELYEELQKMIDTILEHLLPIKNLTLSSEEVKQIEAIEETVSCCMQSAKNTKNIHNNIIMLREIDNELTNSIYSTLLENTVRFYLYVAHFTEGHPGNAQVASEGLKRTYKDIQTYHNEFMPWISKKIAGKFIEEIHIPTMLNINTYSYESFSLMIKAVDIVFIEQENLL